MKFVYALLAIWATWALLHWLMVRRAARKIVKQQKAIYSGPHEYRYCDPREVGDLDLNFYSHFRQTMQALGFRWMMDVEDLTLTRNLPSMRTVICCCLSPQGHISAAAFHFKARGFTGAMVRVAGSKPSGFVYDIETEFSNGTFLCTSNGMMAARTREFDGIRRLFRDTSSVIELLTMHTTELERMLAAMPGVQPLAFSSVEELHTSQARQEEIKHRAKAARNYIDSAELQQIANPGQEGAAKAVGREIDKLGGKQ